MKNMLRKEVHEKLSQTKKIILHAKDDPGIKATIEQLSKQRAEKVSTGTSFMYPLIYQIFSYPRQVGITDALISGMEIIFVKSLNYLFVVRNDRIKKDILREAASLEPYIVTQYQILEEDPFLENYRLPFDVIISDNVEGLLPKITGYTEIYLEYHTGDLNKLVTSGYHKNKKVE